MVTDILRCSEASMSREHPDGSENRAMVAPSWTRRFHQARGHTETQSQSLAPQSVGDAAALSTGRRYAMPRDYGFLSEWHGLQEAPSGTLQGSQGTLSLINGPSDMVGVWSRQSGFGEPSATAPQGQTDVASSATGVTQIPLPVPDSTGGPLHGTTSGDLVSVAAASTESSIARFGLQGDAGTSDVKDWTSSHGGFGESRASDVPVTAGLSHDVRTNQDTGQSARATSMPSVGTPSTVSTAPSTDDASLGADYKLDDPSSVIPHLLNPMRQHVACEDSLLPSFAQAGPSWPLDTSLPCSLASPHAWGGSYSDGHRVASFREGAVEGSPESKQSRFGFPTIKGSKDQWRRDELTENQASALLLESQMSIAVDEGLAVNFHGLHGVSGSAGCNTCQSMKKTGAFPQQPLVHSTIGGSSRGTRNQKPHSNYSHRQASPTTGVAGPHLPVSNPQRSSSEILKTLLRKKACLYEPDTSRSVALVTWLVGRELALEYGFFSRQQLQSGVHSCVASKIECGTITRTKVNRCMQIILNSCFHYIIPRSDGSEERGDSFQASFAETVRDDSYLLGELPVPWDDLVVERDMVIGAALNDVDEKPASVSKSVTATPKSSPRLSSVQGNRSPSKDSAEIENGEFKRAVLLCFNENVRSAEDVFRCHNEFIRDTANASHLQLSAQEWRAFFGREASRTPFLWGDARSPRGSKCFGELGQPDVLGQMNEAEMNKFRTTWCTKRYDHDEDLCGFAHVEVNCGWLRRDPSTHDYKDEMCTFVSISLDRRVSTNQFVLNECPKGVMCGYAHSSEEILYHPKRYKAAVCSSRYGRLGFCYLGDVCPNFHPAELQPPSKRLPEKRNPALRSSRRNEQSVARFGGKACVKFPSGAPVVYASPAPLSSFERQLTMPGLRNLFRRQSSVVRADMRTSGCSTFHYSQFSDDWGIVDRVVDD